MHYTNWIALLGGLAFFLYGMNVMSSSMEKLAGGKMEKTLRKLTSNKFKGVALGAGITAVIQSSGAMTVMLVGLVNSGIMTLEAAVPTLLGSNIGTTITAWILSLAGISSDNPFVAMLKPENFAPVIAIICVVILMASKKQKRRDVATILLGFAILMSGMTTMSDAMKPIGEVPAFRTMLIGLKNPILAVLFGLVFTALLQSSSAVSGILQAMSLTGLLTYGTTIPVIMGLNIGSCVAAIIASIGTSKNAKRVAAVHVSFNTICTILFLSIWLILKHAVPAIGAFSNDLVTPVTIAIIHTTFNVAGTILMLPFTNQLCKLASFIVRDRKHGKHRGTVLLDENLLTIPSFAVNKSYEVTKGMADVAKDACEKAIAIVADNNTADFSEKAVEAVLKLEDRTDHLQDELQTFIVKISKEDLTDKDIKKVYKMLHTIPDFERLADHAENLTEIARDKSNKDIQFSHGTIRELEVLYEAVEDILDRTDKAFDENDVKLAKSIEPLEEVIDGMITEIKSRQVKRLQAGNATVEIGFILTDLLTNLERIGDHCSNIAVAIIEGESEEFDHHEYLSNLKKTDDGNFMEQYGDFRHEYSIGNSSYATSEYKEQEKEENPVPAGGSAQPSTESAGQ